ncbi:MAG: hypothetical protein LHV69_11990 [Elusimicrobia bacterium]|nr:hypothetical protein [Candidatus Obscuribacterium magneticum]
MINFELVISTPVIPAKAGIQVFDIILDSGFRRNDEIFSHYGVAAFAGMTDYV